MTLTEQDNWLLVQLEASETSPDLDWSELVKWKIPQDERVYISGSNTWLVKKRHRQLISTLHFVYKILIEEDPPLEVVKQASWMIEHIERGYLDRRDMGKKPSGLLGFQKEDVGRN